MRRIHNLIIVDESGSMDCIRRQTLTGINETLQSIRSAQKKHNDQMHLVTLICFNSEDVRTLYDAVPANEATDIPKGMYVPDGCTPLYDAVGNGITSISRKSERGDSVIVTIITDGAENSSREYNHSMLTRLISQKKEEDWLFKFIGANIDVKAVSEDLLMDSYIEFEQTTAGTRKAFRKNNKAFDKIMCCMEAAPCGASMKESLDSTDIFKTIDDSDDGSNDDFA